MNGFPAFARSLGWPPRCVRRFQEWVTEPWTKSKKKKDDCVSSQCKGMPGSDDESPQHEILKGVNVSFFA